MRCIASHRLTIANTLPCPENVHFKRERRIRGSGKGSRIRDSCWRIVTLCMLGQLVQHFIRLAQNAKCLAVNVSVFGSINAEVRKCRGQHLVSAPTSGPSSTQPTPSPKPSPPRSIAEGFPVQTAKSVRRDLLISSSLVYVA